MRESLNNVLYKIIYFLSSMKGLEEWFFLTSVLQTIL